LTFVDEILFYYGLFFRIGTGFGLIPSEKGDMIEDRLEENA
jgi:hypothetical protein